ncbi:MAG: preprotein translocase subunit SecE [Elusimicrobiales bacterium]|nr:preprotein translocase subunit SecE [Elusimicrobiales bacterium]
MNTAINFVKEAYAELSRATWMPRDKVVQSTIFVFMVVILVAAFVNTIDFGLARILDAVIGGR